MKLTKETIALIAAILAAGMWLGTLQNRVDNLEHQQRWLHGDMPAESAR